MSYDHVIYEKQGHVAYVTLNRPERMNALDKHSHGELIEIFDDFAADANAWLAIITGAGDRAFCAGNDLKATAEASANGEQRVDSRSRFAAITRGYDCPKPLIAAVNGVAAGGGFEIALACDLVIAADTARFALPEPRVGLIAGAGGIHRLSRQIPLKHAMGMLLTGRFVSAQEGYRLGFVNEVVPAAELMAAAERWASQILECSPLLVSAHQGIGAGRLRTPVDEAIDGDWQERIPRMLASQDYIEGPKAFSEKRKPAWTGR